MRFATIVERTSARAAVLATPAAIALRGLLRHRGRTVVTLAAIAFGTAALIVSGGFLHDVFVQLGETIIHSQTGHLQVGVRGFFTHGSRSAEKHVIADPAHETAAIRSLPAVADVMARIQFAGLLNNGRSDFPIVAEGIEPGREAALGSSAAIVSGRALSDRDGAGLLVGTGVARALDLHVGDAATLLVSTPDGAMNTHEGEVVGIFQSFSKDYDARAVKLPLASAQTLLGTRGANVLVLSLARTEDTVATAARLQESVGARGLEVRTWQELNDFYAKTVDMYDGFFAVFRVIILIMVLLGVANAVNMSVLERVGEFGTMRALGNTRSDVVLLVLFETAMTAVIGAIAGAVGGVLLALLVSRIGIPMPPPPNSNIGYTAHIRIVPSVIVWAIVIALVATLAACVPAALRISRMSIVDALRRNA